MATSEVEICNIALARIGVTDFITALTDESDEARVCSLLYAPTRDAVLSAAPWPFAMRRAELTLVLEGGRGGWGYEYALPADCLLARDIWSGNRNPRPDQRTPYALEHDTSNNKILLTDQKEAELVYTAKITSVGLFPPLFTHALGWLLAAELAMPLAVKESFEVRARQRYHLALSEAAAVALNEGVPDPEAPSVFEAARS